MYRQAQNVQTSDNLKKKTSDVLDALAKWYVINFTKAELNVFSSQLN
jgi:hypothetical protein